MIRIFRRRRPHDLRVVAAVRHSLERHAVDAPGGEHFAERVLAALDRAGDDPYAAPARPVPRRRRALVPVLSAVAVLAVVAAVVLGVAEFGGDADRGNTATGQTSSPPTSAVPRTSTPTFSRAPSDTGTASADGTGRVITFPTLSNVQIQDVTFTGADDGWALASADCLTASGRCTALLRTTDGTVWKSHPNTPFNVRGVQDCAAPCVTNLRFATDRIGYAFGPSAFFMTVNGGDSWSTLPGGALGLETADGNVVRVTSAGTGCPGPCDIGVETSSIGSTTWTKRTVGNTQIGAVTGAQLARNGNRVFLLVTANPAGGADNETSVLFASDDDGVSWTRTGEPCAQVGGEQDSITVAANGEGAPATLCRLRGSSYVRLTTSGDGGASFELGHATVPSTNPDLLAGGGQGTWLVGGTTLARTTNGGDTWTVVSQVGGPVSWVGFESNSIARVVTDGGSVIWTTRDAGKTWTKVRFG